MAGFSSLSDLVSAFESGSRTPGSGQTYSTDPRSTAQGSYSFVTDTWQRYARAAGVSLAQYPTANSAPQSVQDQVFAQAVATRGLGDWTCPGCNPALNDYLGQHPEAANLPVFASGTGGDTLTMAPDQGITQDFWGGTPGPGGSPGLSQPIYSDPATGGAAVQGEPQTGPGSTAQSGQSVLPALGIDIADLFTRGGLVLLAIVLIGAAAWALSRGELGQQVRRAA